MSYVKIGVAGPVGSGKTALIEALSRKMAKDCTTWNVPRTIHTVWMWSCNTWHLKRYRILNRISCTADHHPKYSNERILLYHSVLDRMGC